MQQPSTTRMAEAQLTGCIIPLYEQTGRQPVQAQFVGHLGRDCVCLLLSTERKRQPVNEHQAKTALAADKRCPSPLCFQKHLAGRGSRIHRVTCAQKKLGGAKNVSMVWSGRLSQWILKGEKTTCENPYAQGVLIEVIKELNYTRKIQKCLTLCVCVCVHVCTDNDRGWDQSRHCAPTAHTAANHISSHLCSVTCVAGTALNYFHEHCFI